MEQYRLLSLKNIIVFIIIVALIALALYSLDILMMLFGAFVITCAINPLINKMEKYIPRVWCVTIILLALIVISCVILIPIIAVSVREAASFVGNFPDTLNVLDKISNIKLFNKTLGDLITFDSFKDALVQGAHRIFENSLSVGKFIGNFLTTLFAIAIMVFYFAYDEKRLTDKFIEFFPADKKDRARQIFDNIAAKVGNYIFAQGLAMLFVGILTTIGLLFLHHSHAFLLGFITCVLDIIPVVGPAIAVCSGLLSSVGGGFVYVLLTFVVFMVAQWAQNQFLRPILFGKLLNVHPLMIIVALLASARFLGFWGVVLSPAIACVICVLVDELYLSRINGKNE